MNNKFKNNIFLHPDNAVLTTKEIFVTTVLGSCVAVTMFCKKNKAGAISHSSLPLCPDLGLNLNLNSELVYKYVDSSIHKMINWFSNKDIIPSQLEVKIFGGSNYFVDVNGKGSVFNIGKRNSDTALDIIKDFNIKPKAVDIGGRDSRKIIFNVFDGAVLLKRVSQIDSTNKELSNE